MTNQYHWTFFSTPVFKEWAALMSAKINAANQIVNQSKNAREAIARAKIRDELREQYLNLVGFDEWRAQRERV